MYWREAKPSNDSVHRLLQTEVNLRNFICYLFFVTVCTK